MIRRLVGFPGRGRGSDRVVINRFAWLALAGLALGGGTVSAQESAVEVELDAFWAEVVRSVEEWSVEAQRATYHPDAISVSGDSGSYGTKLMSEAFDEAVGEGGAPSNPRLTFRFSSRVHDTNTAHEVGLYRFLADGQEPFYGGVDSYLVKKDGRWMILLEIQRREGLSEAEWDALGGSF